MSSVYVKDKGMKYLAQEQLPKTILMLSKKPRSSKVRIKDIVSDLANAEIGGRGVQVH